MSYFSQFYRVKGQDTIVKELLFAFTIQTGNYWGTLSVGIVHIKDERQELAYDNLSVAIIISLVRIFVLFFCY